ncbi:glia maturation factor beta-like protein [Syncephalastrum racemosum]|uniref:Glia maturation factor beta-like protein n=1 Tax=Syncephalastrum racemosum TaxID=13706 RepID=A0A1X2H5U4_SYNRA|nr:glia maturation factor beta-like protein [Syncephalastrum racemosum]
MSSTCDISPELVEKIKEFRFAKYSSGNAAFVLQIDRKKLEIVEDEVHDNISVEDLVEELPENSPRFIILSYELTHSDGRKNFPLVFIYWSPSTAKAEINMLYASAKTFLQEKINVNRGFDIREPEQFTDEFLSSQLKSV